MCSRIRCTDRTVSLAAQFDGYVRGVGLNHAAKRHAAAQQPAFQRGLVQLGR